MYNNTSTPIKITLNKFISLFLLSIAVSGCYDETMTAGGPGTGGTGPIVVTSSNESLTSAHDASIEDIASIYDAETEILDEPSLDNQNINKSKHAARLSVANNSSNPSFLVETINKSTDNQVCGDFKRSVSLITEDGNTTDSLSTNTTQLKLQVTVTNLTDKEQVEIQHNCRSFRAIDKNGNDVDTINDNLDACEIPTQDLLFLPKQQHNYQLTLDTADTISPLIIKYINQVGDIDETNVDKTKVTETDDCNTFIELKTTQQ